MRRRLTLVALLSSATLWTASVGRSTQDPGATLVADPGPVPAERFHPERESLGPLTPRRGGEVVVHVDGVPATLNYMLTSSGATRRVLYELHEFLLQRDWETWEMQSVLCDDWTVSDTLVVHAEGSERRLYGQVEQSDASYRLVPSDGSEPIELAEDVVIAHVPQSAFSFTLRADVVWHDGHPLGVDDVLFSYACLKNTHVRSTKSFKFSKLSGAEAIGERTVRFTLERPYYLAESIFESFTILPSHVFDLRDPDNPDHRASADDEEQAKYLHEHPANRQWVGLGPYRLTQIDSQSLRAERFDAYFDPANGGYLDALRWRAIGDEAAGTNALINGELDFFDRLAPQETFGPGSALRERAYVGWYYTPVLTHTGWNVRRAPFDDARVRRALARCFDWDGFIQSHYLGQATRATGEQYCVSPAYDRTLVPIGFDLERAREELADAGWYDRDGDGWIDRDGVAFEFEYLSLAGNRGSRLFGLRFQELLQQVGVRMEITEREWSAFVERLRAGDFESYGLAWVQKFETDPEQLWHSRWATPGSSNRVGLENAAVDALIEALQAELDLERRRQLSHALQREVYSLQPCMFGVYSPRRFAISREIRNFQIFALDPGYSLRRWYLETP